MILRTIIAALLVALWAVPAAQAAPSDTLRAWRTAPPAEAETLTAGHRLVGLACGADRLTMTAIEEDHFPVCDTIAPVDELCPEDATLPPEAVTAAECARYMGDGW
jgi:hypothetical protein